MIFYLPLFLNWNLGTINKRSMPSCSSWKAASFNSASNFEYVCAPSRRVKPFLKPDEHFRRNFSATEKTWCDNIFISFFFIHFHRIWTEMISLACWRTKTGLTQICFLKMIEEIRVVCFSGYHQQISLACIMALFERALLGAVSKNTLRNREKYDSA